MKPPTKNRVRRWLFLMAAGLLSLCMLAASISALSNINLPDHSPTIERLGELDKARLEEIYHLRQTLGEELWSGWGQADIPVILYNEEYAFLTGYPDPPDGWVKVPQNVQRGGPWEIVPGDTFQGQPYYRQRLPGPGITPEAFAVLVGDRWAASMSTEDWMRIGLRNQIRQDVPAPFKYILPYRLTSQILVNSSDWYICSVLHESFHAFQGMTAPNRLADSENIQRTAGDRYPRESGGFRAAWQAELNLLGDAVLAPDLDEAADLTRQFLSQREARRSEYNLAPEMVDYERQREWLEGLAKYTELAIWKQASQAPGYQPAEDLKRDPDFKVYATFNQRWSQETAQIKRMAGQEGDGRFYYSGMAQAFLLDKLMPGWKTRIFEKGVFLEDILREALESRT
jgi:hypothetical protein